MENNQNIDFLAVGDVFNDTFIELEDAHVTCNINNEDCTISMKFGDKLPYKSASVVRGVGNAGNSATCASRLGLSSSLLTITGNDDDGAKIFEHFEKEHVSQVFMKKDDRLPTNNAYVLKYGPERTILVKQEAYPYIVPTELLNTYKPKWIYLTSIGKSTLEFHHQFVQWLAQNPDTKLAFQPGTFQMQLGRDVLADVYKASEIFFCNKEEAQRILELPNADFKELHTAMHALGPKTVVITDGVKGLTASTDSEKILFLPMYPDPKPPISRTGAGDATSTTITVALSLGLPFEQALLWGPINSMNVVQHVGAQEGLLSRQELENYLKNAPDYYKITTL
jgi:ribokinase